MDVKCVTKVNCQVEFYPMRMAGVERGLDRCFFAP
jgi:hypothetical protein